MNRIFYVVNGTNSVDLFENRECAEVHDKINNTYSGNNRAVGVIEYEGEAKFGRIYSKEGYIDLLIANAQSMGRPNIFDRYIQYIEVPSDPKNAL